MEAGFDHAGNVAAAAGTLRDSILRQEELRLAESRIRRLVNRNHHLEELLDELRGRVGDYDDLEISLPSLRGLSAAVVSYDSVPGRSSILIAAGTVHGLAGGEVVSVDGAAAGVVSETTRLYSRVTLLTDPRSSVVVRSKRTRTLYVMRGEDGVYCSLDLADKYQDVREGDIFITATVQGDSANRGFIPPGLPVARVESVEKNRSNPLFRRIKVVPLAGLDRLEHVIVLIPGPEKPE